MATLADTGILVDYQQTEDELQVGGDNVKRRLRERKTLEANFTDGQSGLFETQQLATPAGYSLVSVSSRLDGNRNHGIQTETFEKLGAYTTTTTT